MDNMKYGDAGGMECSHGEVELLGEQKGERGSNRYYRCLKCGSVLILSEGGNLYQVAKEEKQKPGPSNLMLKSVIYR